MSTCESDWASIKSAIEVAVMDSTEGFIVETMKRHIAAQLAEVDNRASYEKAVLAQEKRRRVEEMRAKLRIVRKGDAIKDI